MLSTLFFVVHAAFPVMTRLHAHRICCEPKSQFLSSSLAEDCIKLTAVNVYGIGRYDLARWLRPLRQVE